MAKKNLPKHDIIITHNLREAALLHARKMGGLAAPSLAVVRTDCSLTDFGDITLIGSRKMADPKGYAKTKVYGGDIYSPRYPAITYSLDQNVLNKLNECLEPARAVIGGREIYGGDIRKLSDLEENSHLRFLVLKDMGINIEPGRNEKGEIEPWVTTTILQSALAKNDGYDRLKGKAIELLEKFDAQERIFVGYANNGKPKYVPHTIENVVKILKKELRGGEGSSNGVGSVRALFTKQFRSLKDIEEASDRLVSKDDFLKVKEDIQEEFDEIRSKLTSYHSVSNRLGFGDTVAMMMQDVAKMNVVRALEESGFGEVPNDIRQEILEFVQKLVHLPTEYFEAKIVDEVRINEFSGAVIPSTASKEVKEFLNSQGIVFAEYATKEERAAVLKSFVEELHHQKGNVLINEERPNLKSKAQSQKNAAELALSFLDEVSQGAGNLMKSQASNRTKLVK